MNKKINIRTYADCGRIATSTIQKVAIAHIAHGNTDLSLNALQELKSSINAEYQAKMDDYNVLIKIASNNQTSTEDKQRMLISNKFRFDITPKGRIRTIAPIIKKGVSK